MADVETNKRVVVDFYETGFGGDPQKAIADHLGPVYIQHHPGVADGPQAFIDVVEKMRGENPEMKLEIKRVVAEGDLVATHSELVLEPGGPSLALADFFRVEDGKVVEHWDVISDVPAESPGETSIF